MERVPLYVDDMGETVFADDLRAGLYFIRLRAKQGIRSPNKTGRLANKRKARLAEAARKVNAEQRAEDHSTYLLIRAEVDRPGHMPYLGGDIFEHIHAVAAERAINYVPRTARWNR